MYFSKMIVQLQQALKTNQPLSIFYVGASFILIYATHQNNYWRMKYDVNTNITNYLDLYEFAQSVHFLVEMIEIITFMWYVSFFFLIILIYCNIFRKGQELTDQFYAKIFLRMVRPFYWVFFLPLTSLYFQEIKNQQGYYKTGWFNVFLILILVMILNVFFLKNQYFKGDFLKSDSLQLNYIFFIVRISECLASVFQQKNQSFIIGYQVISIFIGFLHYYMAVICRFCFYDSLINSIYQYGVSILIGQSVGQLIYELFNLEENYLFTIILFVISPMIVNFQLVNRFVSRRYFKTHDYKEQILALTNNNRKEDDYVFYQGLLFQHMSQCVNGQCFTKQAKFYYSKRPFLKGQEYKIIFASRKQRAIILRFLIKCLYETYLKDNQNDNVSRIGYAEFLYFKMNQVYQANIQLTILNASIKNISEKFKVFYLSYIIQQAMQEKCESSYMNRLPFQQVLLCEETLNHVKRTINSIMIEMVNYWRLQCQSKIFQEELIVLSQKINQYFRVCQKGFKQIRNFHLHHESNVPRIIQQSWVFYQMLYKVKIRCKKLKICELEQLPNSQLKACEIFVYENIDESSSDDDKENQPYNSNKIISENTAIIMTDQCGIIMKTNAKMTQVFGMLNSMYVGISIDKLMTKFYQDNHKIFMEQFQRSGKISTLYNRTSIFCEDSNGILFKARKYIKILMNIYVNRFEYVSMIRPVKHKYNYITLNENWEIDSMTFEMKTLIGDNLLPLLIICPKTLCISEYRFLMTQGDLQKFNLKVIKDSSKISIHERALTVKNRFDETFSHLKYDEGSRNSIVLKSELRINREEEMIDIFRQGLEEDNEDIQIHAFENEQQVHKKLNIRIPLNNFELITDYHYLIEESMKKVKYSGEVKVGLLIKDERGKTKIVKEEFIRRYKSLLKQYRLVRYECLKLLFDKYCSKPELLQRVIKVDSYIKTYDTLNNKKFYTIKISRYEIFDASKSFTAFEIGKSANVIQNSKNEQPKLQRGFHVQKSSEYSEMQSNREQNSQILLQNNILGCDFDYTAQSEQVFSLKADGNQFIKEEQNKPTKNDRLTKKVFIYNRLYFLIQLVLTLLQFFICGFQYNNLTKSESIYLIREIIKYQLYAVESYSMIVDIELFNLGYLDSILLNSSLTQFSTKDDFYQKSLIDCQEYAFYNYYVQLQSDFIKMTYQNFYIHDSSNRSGLDVQAKYQEAIYSFNKTELESITEGDRVLEFYRQDMLTYFAGLTFDTISNLFQNGYDYQILSNTNYYIIALIMLFIFFVDMIIQYNYIYQHIQNTEVIYNQVNIIKKQTKLQCLQQKQILALQLNFLNGYETDQYQSDKLLYLNDLFTKQVDSVNQAFPIENLQEQEMLNDNDSKQTIIPGNFYSFRKSLFHLNSTLISNILSNTTEFLGKYDDLFQCKQISESELPILGININQRSQYFPLYQQIYVNKELFSTQMDYNSAKNIIDSFITENTQLESKLYSTNIPAITQLFESNVCDQIELSEFQSNLCVTQVNGALSRGIQEYYQYLEQLSLTTLYDDPRFDTTTLEYIYHLNSVQPIVIALYKMIINIWYNDILNQMDSLTKECLVVFLIQIAVLIIMHTLLIEVVLKNYLYSNYKAAKQYYKLYMPNSSINQEKIIRVQIIRTGLLRK